MINLRSKTDVPLFRQYYRQRGLLVMLLPCLLVLIIFSYVPMIGLVIAFKNYSMADGILGSPWIGLENFQRLFSNPDFPRAFRNTIVISFLRLVFGFCSPLILALMLNELRITWYKRGVQVLTYLPYFFSWVMLGGIFLMLFSINGPINAVLKTVGITGISFLGSDKWFIVILIATGIWQVVGYGAVIYLAALAGISPTLYEVAAIDGAGRWRQTLHITLPCLVPTMVVLFILSLGHILNAGFDQIYNMYNPLVYDVADILDTYVLRRMLSFDYDLATAAGLFKSVIGLLLIVSANWITRRFSSGEHGIW